MGFPIFRRATGKICVRSNTTIYTNRLINKLIVKKYVQIMNMKISAKTTMIIIMTVILTVPSTMLQISQAQAYASGPKHHLEPAQQ